VRLVSLQSGHPCSSPAEQGARANAGICHAACDRKCFRSEIAECESQCCTRRASSHRGSSMTLGLSGPMRQPKFLGSSKRRNQRESAVSEVRVSHAAGSSEWLDARTGQGIRSGWPGSSPHPRSRLEIARASGPACAFGIISPFPINEPRPFFNPVAASSQST
jgi:hypothetical protein